MWIWFCVVAMAGSEDWQLHATTWRIDTPIEVEQPLSHWEFDDGYLFEIRDGRNSVGTVFVGDGQWTVSFDSATDAIVTANRMAVLENADAAALVSVAAGGDLVLDVDRGLMVGHDVWTTVRPTLLKMRAGEKWLSESADGTTEVWVQQQRPPREARNIAQKVLSDRTQWMRTHRYDPASMITVDRWTPEVAPVWMVDMHTNRNWSRLAGVKTFGSQSPWLSYIRDDAGVINPQASAQVEAQDIDQHGRRMSHVLTQDRFPVAADGTRGPSRHVDVVEAIARHAFLPKDGGMTVETESITDLSVVAKGGPAGLVWINIPHTEQQPYGSFPPIPNGWKLDALTTPAGDELDWVHLPLTPDEIEGRGSSRTIAVRLDPPLAEGESRKIRIQWHDRHRYAHLYILPVGDGGDVEDMGTATDLLPVLPVVRTNRNREAQVRVRVGSPSHLVGHRPILSGSGQKRWTEAGWSWVESHADVIRSTMAVGKFELAHAPGTDTLPAVHTAVRNANSDQVAHEVRQTVNLFQTVLPPYPESDVHVAELVAPMGITFAQSGGGGMIGVYSTRLLTMGLSAESGVRNRYPHLERVWLAMALHSHYWLDQELRGTDHSLPDILGAVYGLGLLEATNGLEDANTWREAMTACARPKDGRIGPIPRSGGGCTGAAILDGPLTTQVDRPGLFEAVDRIMRREFPASWEGLQQSLESVSGESLGGFFDLWVYGGLAPAVAVSWQEVGGELVGTVTSDVPFGDMKIPLNVTTSADAFQLMVDVHDGAGRFTVAWPHDPIRNVTIAPEVERLLRRSSVAHK